MEFVVGVVWLVGASVMKLFPGVTDAVRRVTTDKTVV